MVKGGDRRRATIVPFHPLSARQPAADDDQPDRASCRTLVKDLSKLADAHSGVLFQDVNRGGNHDFGHEHFADSDHLNKAGAGKLTGMVEAMIRTDAVRPEDGQ